MRSDAPVAHLAYEEHAGKIAGGQSFGESSMQRLGRAAIGKVVIGVGVIRRSLHVHAYSRSIAPRKSRTWRGERR